MECKCGYKTNNAKSYSNHKRGSCGKILLSDKDCKFCSEKLPVTKPSVNKKYCNRYCYVNWKLQNKECITGIYSTNYKHGESRQRLHRTYTDMIKRCYEENSKDYINYGGRGIIVCPEWINDYSLFKSWALSNGYENNLTIERINVNGNYEPLNCTWIPNNQQAKNRRNTKPRITNQQQIILCLEIKNKKTNLLSGILQCL